MTQNNDNDGKGIGNEPRQSQYPNQDELDELDRKLEHDLTARATADHMKVVQLDGDESSIPLYSTVCTYCVWWNPKLGRGCKAYPTKNGIPMTIWMGRETHVYPYKGDHGVQFTTAPNVKRLPDNIQNDLEKRSE